MTQYAATWADINLLKQQGLLNPGVVYILVDLYKIGIVAKTCDSFHPIPYMRTAQGLEYDEEHFDFDNKVIIGIDNINCAIRCTGGTWAAINDTGHRPHKIGAVTNNVMVHFTKTYDKVIGGSTSIDETYSGSNLMVSCGASISFAYIAIYLHKTTILGAGFQKTQMTALEASIPWSNIFVNVKASKQIPL